MRRHSLLFWLNQEQTPNRSRARRSACLATAPWPTQFTVDRVHRADFDVAFALCSFSDLNALVADYLFTEGFKSAAENFSREAGISPPIDLDSLESRMQIRRAVQRGDVESATEMVNDLDPEVSDISPSHATDATLAASRWGLFGLL